jgi:deazaflavin-dependent oxidoreductase (nitroreductase family)
VDSEQRRKFNEGNIAEFRATAGRIASFGDAPVLLLTTTGAKSGLPRTNPMMYLADDHDPNRLYVFASAAGADTNPAWFTNLVHEPDELTVEVDRETVMADAEILPEPTRTEIFAVQAQRYQGFAGYQAKTTRLIPVVALRLRRAYAS